MTRLCRFFTPARAAAQQRGFTMIEMLAVLLLLSLVMGFVIDAYFDLSNATTRASQTTRYMRRTATLLDRIADDFGRAMLVRKPDSVDPLTHPWLFLGESHESREGADHIKFDARRAANRRSEGPVSDVETVAYVLRLNEKGDAYALYRWSYPQLPDGLDRDFPAAGDPASLLLTDGVQAFGVRFLTPAGDWLDSWDSSQLEQSGTLPVAVQIRLSLMPPADAPDGVDAVYSRLVRLPLPALDLEALFDPATYGGEAGAGANAEDADRANATLADCIDFQALRSSGTLGALSPDQFQAFLNLEAQADSILFEPYRSLVGSHPAVRAECR
jgi:prepilin-type N-terminal cleavage/methylation domain-containing protein